MAEKKQSVPELIAGLAQPLADELGLVLWDVSFGKEGPGYILRLTIDKPGGVFIDDCEKMSRAIDPLLDENDFTDKEYCLEVSSPGLMRELRTDAHLAAFAGKGVIVRLYKADESKKKEYTGTLGEWNAETVTLHTEEGDVTFVRSDVAHIKADDDVQIGGKRK